MIKGIRSILFSVLIFSFLITQLSCNKDSDKNLLFEDCESSVGMLAFFNDLKNNSDYILSFTEQEDCYVFTFAIAESIAISKDCIESVSININEQTINITYFDRLLHQMRFGPLKEISYTHNPLGYTPLSGQISINSEISGEITIDVKNKNQSLNPSRSYSYDSGELKNIPLLGLYYNFDNEIYIEFVGADQKIIKDTFKITIGNAPDYLPQIIVDHKVVSDMEPGMNFVSYRSKSDPAVPFMIDADGELRYVLDFSFHPELFDLNYDVGMERLQNGNFYFGAWPKSDLYEVDILGKLINKWVIPGYEFHHNVQEKENGNLLVTATKVNELHDNGKISLEDYILEIDRNSGQITTTWDLKESLDEYRSTLGTDVFDNFIDWIHVNAVIEDPSDNTIIISSRFQGIIKLDYSNQVKWIINCHLGWETNRRNEDLNQYLLQPLDQSDIPIDNPQVSSGEINHPDFEWPWYQHAPFLMENGNLFVFDNGERRNFNFYQQYSRAVEYEIDEQNLTIKQVWQYGKERGTETFSRIVSDVDYLPIKNNILFCPGYRVNNGVGLGGKIVEIDYETKEVISEMRLMAEGIVFHRAERMPLYPH